MPRLFSNFTRLHGYVAGGLLAIFMAACLFLCLMMWKPNPGVGRIAIATLAAVSGPFTGAIARPDDRASWIAAWDLLPVCASSLVVGILFQVLPLPFRRGASVFRIGMWIIGLVVWFGAVILSLLNALD